MELIVCCQMGDGHRSAFSFSFLFVIFIFEFVFSSDICE